MQKLWPPPKIQLMIKVHIHFGHVPIQEILKYLYYFFQVHGSHLLTSSYERLQSSPWILTLAVLIGSVGFTVLVLAFFLLQNRRICSRRRTYDSSDDMELVTNIIVNPNYQAENDRTLLTNEGHNDRQALLTCNFIVPRRPAVCLWNHFYTYSAFLSPDSTPQIFLNNNNCAIRWLPYCYPPDCHIVSHVEIANSFGVLVKFSHNQLLTYCLHLCS